MAEDTLAQNGACVMCWLLLKCVEANILRPGNDYYEVRARLALLSGEFKIAETIYLEQARHIRLHPMCGRRVLTGQGFRGHQHVPVTAPLRRRAGCGTHGGLVQQALQEYSHHVHVGGKSRAAAGYADPQPDAERARRGRCCGAL